MNDLPTFKYHPDPVATGYIVLSETTCICCNQARGYIYTGPNYAEEDYDDQLCPWCIADGSASLKFDLTFTDKRGIGGYGQWDSVPEEVVSEVACRTPGFSGWHDERWWTHCGDAAAFVGNVGRMELEAAGGQAMEAIRLDTGFSGDDWVDFLLSLDKDGSPTGFLFQCRHCRIFGGYQEYD